MKQELINIIDSYRYLPYGWDNYCSNAPNNKIVDDAIIFVKTYINSEKLPISRCSEDYIMLDWESKESFLEISFNGNNTYSYYLIDYIHTKIYEEDYLPLSVIPNHLLQYLKVEKIDKNYE